MNGNRNRRTEPQITIVVPGRWHAFDLAKELNQLGVLHRIVTNYPKSRTRRWNIPNDKVVSLPVSLLLTKMAWRISGEKLARRYAFVINDIFARKASNYLGTPDLVHAWSGAAEPVLKVAKSQGISTVLERSSSHMLEQCRILREEYAKLGLKWSETPAAIVERELREYETVDRVFVPSLFVERSFIQRDFPQDRLFRNGFGVDLSCFTPGEKHDDVFRVVYVGSLSVRKGVHYLVKAFLKADIENSELLLVGSSTPEAGRLIGSTDPRIRRMGHVFQHELPGLYRTGSVFTMASLEEGQALVQAQALACGLPIVCSTNTGGEDFLVMSGAGKMKQNNNKEFPAGYLVPVANAPAIAAALAELAFDNTRLYLKRRGAREIAKRDLSWKRYATANLEEYERIVRGFRRNRI